jgi:type 1 glutamine amidotransferase
MTNIVFFVGGPAFHPVAEQARAISRWLDEDTEQHFTYDIREGNAAFDNLDDCDLLVIMGLYWTGMSADWVGRLHYQPLNEQQKHTFETYVASARPLLCHHGGIASYDDWSAFGRLLGFTWQWGVTSHSPIGTHKVTVPPSDHPLVAHVHDYELYDELYYNVQVTDGQNPLTLAYATWEGQQLPMVMVIEGDSGRIPGAGRSVYLANGHDMRAFSCPMLRQLWVNSVSWLTT